MRYDYYMCFVTGNNVANYLPFIDSNSSVDGADVIFFTSEKMINKFEKLKEVINKTSIRIDFNDVNLSVKITEQLNLEQYRDKSILFNITGGTKSMSLKAFIAGINTAHQNVTFMLVDQNDNSSIEFYDQTGNATSSDHHQYNLKILNYLALYNTAQISKQDTLTAQIKFINQLLSLNREQIRKISNGFNKLNWICFYDKIKPHNNQFYLSDYKFNCPTNEINGLNDIFTMLAEFNLINSVPNGNNHIVDFTSEGNHRFCTGVWLEIYVYKMLEKMKKEEPNLISDLSLGVSVNYGDRNFSNNELDVVFTAKSSMYYLECKTGKQVGRNFNEIIEKIGYLGSKLYMKCKVITNDTLDSIKSENLKRNDLNKLIEKNQILDINNVIDYHTFKKSIIDWVK